MNDEDDICKTSGHCCCGFHTCCDCGEEIPLRPNDGKHSCDDCDKLAVWHYAPSGGTGNYCDLCVPRGCSCNVIDFDDPSPDAEQHTDDQHRLLPCCEYWYNEDGWEDDL